MRRLSPFPRPLWVIPALAVVFTLVVGCQSRAVVVTQMVESEKVIRATIEVEKEVKAPSPTQAPSAPGKAGGSGDSDSVPLAAPYRAQRMIIKNAEMRLLVEDTTVGIDRVTQISIDFFGYLVSSRTWYQGGFQYATLTLGVPSNEYENAIRRLRGIAVRVLDEQASGTDVTDEYVDLESRLRNLEATEARIRSFLDKATTVEESLRVNQELSKITEQIEEIKGRMNYLKDRAAYSTITVHLEPQVPTPTPSPTPTPTPTPTPDVWLPGKTFESAANVLGGILRSAADVLIWIGVILGPFLIPAIVIIWLALRLRRRKDKPE